MQTASARLRQTEDVVYVGLALSRAASSSMHWPSQLLSEGRKDGRLCRHTIWTGPSGLLKVYSPTKIRSSAFSQTSPAVTQDRMNSGTVMLLVKGDDKTGCSLYFVPFTVFELRLARSGLRSALHKRRYSSFHREVQ